MRDSARSAAQRLTRWLPGIAAIAALLTAATAHAEPAVLDGVVLKDQAGKPVGAASFAGKPLLLHFILTTCSATCPVQVHDLAQLRRALPADVRGQLRFLSVSIDPLQDTPAALAAFAKRLGANQPGWQFATGQPAQVERLADRLQVLKPKAQPGQPISPHQRLQDHRTALFLFDASGQLLQRYGGVPVDQPRLTDELTRVARASPAMGAVARN